MNNKSSDNKWTNDKTEDEKKNNRGKIKWNKWESLNLEILFSYCCERMAAIFP